ncbi:uncharacterized protein LOC143203410, partial [Rhynchophorus ferrugineus]|uniref:uncharacterized protein LOC143203410 n=1 Tax=Rhynchophorus ferrugineus TaxID=354439 RepID=UPI003FCD23AA
MAESLRSTVQLLKTFDGTSSKLDSFINQIDTFYARYYTNDQSQQEYVLLAIKSKIIGEAEDFILTRPDLISWDQIKIALQQKFSDPITRCNLQQQLIFLVRNKNEPCLDYIQRLKSINTQINTKICTEVQNLEARNILIKQNELTATQNLLANISNELRTLLIVQNPQNLDSAIDIITNYEILSSQDRFKNNFTQNFESKNQNINLKRNLFLKQNLTTYPKNQFPSQPIPIRPLPVKTYFPPAYATFGKNFQKTQTPYVKSQYPKPMSGVSITPRQPQQSNFQRQYRNQPQQFNTNQNHFKNQYPPGQQRFKIEELTHVERNLPESSSESNDSEMNDQLNDYPFPYDDQNPEFLYPNEEEQNYYVNFPPELEDNENFCSHASLLRPSIAEYYFPETIKPHITTLHTCTGSQKAFSKARIPLFLSLGISQSVNFVLYSFHDYFDGILGIKDLKRLNLNINLEENLLYNDYLRIPFYFREDFSTFIVEIPPNTIKNTRLFTNLPEESSWYIHEYKTDQLTIQPTIVTIKNNSFCVDIKNPTNKHQSIRHSHLNHEEQNSLFKLLQKYRHVLHKTGDKLTFTNEVKHKIKTTDEIPVHVKTYRYPYVHKNEIEKQIAEMLENKIIQPSSSPWSSPVWIVPKKLDASGQRKWRLVIDYRKLNEKTIDDRYPIPNISDILDKLGRAQYFTTLDLASGFHQIEMDPESIQKTAFNVEHGHYEYLRMPFGLKNAPATFQRTMDNVLRGLQGKICLVYMDDIIIFSTSLQEHLESLRKVFDRLTSYNLKIQLDKSEFLKKSVEFLGHVITPEGIKPNPKKVSAIKNFEIPKTPKEIKSFLGLIGYYRKFIKNFAKITKPLRQCLKKNSKVNHDRAFIEAFETCKNILMNDPILQHPDFQKPFILTTDASNFAIGAVLSQGTIGNDLPIAYASRTLSTTECNYSTIEKELLAIVWATKYFRPYLFGRKFSIVTDHKPLQWLFSIKEPNSKLVRWRLKLQEFDFTIHYKKGKQNLNADALSRPPLKHSIEIHPVEIPKPPLTHISEISDRPDVNTEDQYLWLDRVKHFFETQEQIPVFEKPKKINNNNSEYEIWNKNWMNTEYSEKIREIKGNLFEQSTDYSLAHCVAADLRMNKGIACIFKHKYKNQKELLEKKAKEGEILIWPDQKESRNIYYLITKRKSEDKP